MPSARKLAQQQQAQAKKQSQGPQPIGFCPCKTAFFSKYERKNHSCRFMLQQKYAAE